MQSDIGKNIVCFVVTGVSRGKHQNELHLFAAELLIKELTWKNLYYICLYSIVQGHKMNVEK